MPDQRWKARRLVLLDFATFAALAGKATETELPPAPETTPQRPDRRSPAGGVFIGGKLSRRDQGLRC